MVVAPAKGRSGNDHRPGAANSSLNGVAGNNHHQDE